MEIGAGLGSLTLALAETGATVTAIEADRHLLPALRRGRGAGGRPTSWPATRGTLDWAAVLGEAPGVLVANLPYNVATAAGARRARRTSPLSSACS